MNDFERGDSDAGEDILPAMTDEERARGLLAAEWPEGSTEPMHDIRTGLNMCPIPAALRAIAAALRIPAQGVGVERAALIGRVQHLLMSSRTSIAIAANALDPAPVLRDVLAALATPSPSPEREALERAAQIAEAIDSARGNEKEIAKAIRALIPPLPEQEGGR